MEHTGAGRWPGCERRGVRMAGLASGSAQPFHVVVLVVVAGRGVDEVLLVSRKAVDSV